MNKGIVISFHRITMPFCFQNEKDLRYIHEVFFLHYYISLSVTQINGQIQYFAIICNTNPSLCHGAVHNAIVFCRCTEQFPYKAAPHHLVLLQ